VRGLSRRLLAGVPRLNLDTSVSVLDPEGAQIDMIPRSHLRPSDYGYVYERLVGLDYEARGFAVQYRMQFGYQDSGVDLVCERADQVRFVQCKYVGGTISRAKVEKLLYSASAFVARHSGLDRQLFFDLAVPCIALAFPTRVTRRSKRTVPNVALASFERYNQLQRRVRLNVVEVLPQFRTVLQGGAASEENDRESGHNR
jgi:Holliday junction resolvase-like predicted endonuclease